MENRNSDTARQIPFQCELCKIYPILRSSQQIECLPRLRKIFNLMNSKKYKWASAIFTGLTHTHIHTHTHAHTQTHTHTHTHTHTTQLRLACVQ